MEKKKLKISKIIKNRKEEWKKGEKEKRKGKEGLSKKY